MCWFTLWFHVTSPIRNTQDLGDNHLSCAMASTSVSPVAGKVCVVTGGGSGIGAALCQHFASLGAKKVGWCIEICWQFVKYVDYDWKFIGQHTCQWEFIKVIKEINGKFFSLVNWIMRFLQPRKYGEWKQLQVTINADCKKRMVVCHVLFRIPRDVHLTHLSACQHVFQLQETNRKWSLKWFAETMQQEDHENDEDFGRGVLGLAPCHDDRKTNGGKTAGTSKGRLLLISLWHLAVFVGTGRRVTPVPPALDVLHLYRCYTNTWHIHTHMAERQRYS